MTARVTPPRPRFEVLAVPRISLGDMERSDRDAAEVSAEWRRLDAQARAIADRLLVQGPGAVNRLGPQMGLYREIKHGLANMPYLEDRKPDAGGSSRRWERGQWRRLTKQLLMQARDIADQLLEEGPAAVNSLGPKMDRYAAVKKELEQLSYAVAGTHSQAPQAPNW